MTSALMKAFRSPMSDIAAQDLIKLQNSVIKNGMLRKKGRTINIGKWPHRFVVLTHDSVYVYTNEASRTPNSKFSLLGYNRVSRCEIKGHDWCFSIFPASSIDSVKVKTFACITEVDRKAWMLAIKCQIYTANNIHKPAITVIDRIKSMTIGLSDEDDYTAIEQSVYETTDTAVVNKNAEDDDEDSDSSTDSDFEEFSPQFKKTCRSLSLPHNSLFPSDVKGPIKYSKGRKLSECSGEPTSSDYDVCNDLVPAVNTSKQSQRRQPSDPQPRIPSDHEKTPRASSDPIQSPPPPYKDVCGEKEQEADYVNLASIHKDDYYECPEIPRKPSLESLCSTIDMCLDRDKLNAMLQSKQHGTYLIRKSRSEGQQVLAFLRRDRLLKEYKIIGTPDNCTIDKKTNFRNIEELLKHYTSVETLPNTKDYLKRGIKHAEEEAET